MNERKRIWNEWLGIGIGKRSDDDGWDDGWEEAVMRVERETALYLYTSEAENILCTSALQLRSYLQECVACCIQPLPPKRNISAPIIPFGETHLAAQNQLEAPFMQMRASKA